MEETSSLSEGVFSFVPDRFSLLRQRAMRKRKLDEKFEYKWESVYIRVWGNICQEVNNINREIFKKILRDLVDHLKSLPRNFKLEDDIIPCQILLTGSNLPDHKFLLSTFVKDVNEQITSHVATLWSWNCGNIRTIVHNFVSQIIPVGGFGPDSQYLFHMDTDDEKAIKKNSVNFNLLITQYNMSTLVAWYRNEFINCVRFKPAILIIIPDFESFPPSVLGQFIMLVSSYSAIIPFIFVFGVATTTDTVYQSLPRRVLAQLSIQTFRSENSPAVLNNIIENALISEKNPFRLGEKCMNFLTDNFLFHSFSVHAFVQGFRFCVAEHFYSRDHYSLCCTLDEIEDQVNDLSTEEIENIRRISSFQKFVESKELDERKLLLLNNEYTREVVKRMMKDVLEHSRDFFFGVKLLHALTNDLPKTPLGRFVREYYCLCMAGNVQDSDEFKECMKLIEMQSKTELTSKIDGLIKVLSPDANADSNVQTARGNACSPSASPSASASTFASPASVSATATSEASAKLREIRAKLEEFKEQFNSVTDSFVVNESEERNETKSIKSYEVIRKNFLTYFEEGVIKNLLTSYKNLPLQEIFHFDDVAAIRRRISGAPRKAIHLALNNPHRYLDCNCCVLSSPDAIPHTLPDLSIAYKIHLEHNKIINMYDWLQSFAAVVKENKTLGEMEEKEVQARFTRAVSELQFLGFIKPSRVKADHVARLTWENAEILG